MKTSHLKIVFGAAMVLFIAWGISSCSKKNDAAPAVDKTELQAAIDTAGIVVSTTTEGSAEGNFPAGSKATLSTAITAAQGVSSTAGVTQTAVDNATVSLKAAIATYLAGAVLPVAAEDLVAHWKFDEGTGTTVADASGNSHTGTLTVGSQYAGGGAIPTWTMDRKGTASKALHFTGGGHIEVPTNAAFNPAELTISLWANLDSANTATGVYCDNYMISQNYWDGYKLQTQCDKKLFGTVHAVPAIYDRDSDPKVLSLKKWYQLAMTYKDGQLDLYFNGVLVKHWTDTPGAIKTMTDRFDFLIGQELPNAKIVTDPGYVINHFEGTMDEVRIYNKSLTGAQILAIYNQEK